jgi:hypothetical protein
LITKNELKFSGVQGTPSWSRLCDSHKLSWNINKLKSMILFSFLIAANHGSLNFLKNEALLNFKHPLNKASVVGVDLAWN